MQHKAPRLRSGSVCVYLPAHAPRPSARGQQEHPARNCTAETPKQQRETSKLCRLSAAGEPAFDSPHPSEALAAAALQKRRYLEQRECSAGRQLGQRSPSSLQAGTGHGSGGSQVHSCQLHVLGKELQPQLRAQGQRMTCVGTLR